MKKLLLDKVYIYFVKWLNNGAARDHSPDIIITKLEHHCPILFYVYRNDIGGIGCWMLAILRFNILFLYFYDFYIFKWGITFVIHL